MSPHSPRRFRWIAPLFLLVLFAVSSCAPAVVVKKRDEDLKRLSTVGVLLFDRADGAGTRQEAEIMTEVFSLQMRRYFPVLVERFEIEAELKKRGEPVPTKLTAQRARELGKMFDCDAFFTGQVNVMKEQSSLFGLRGANQFALSVTLVSGRTGEVMLTSTVTEEGSFLLPLDSSREIAIHSTREMVKKFGFDEGGPRWLTRDSELWLRAMRAYEERRFWDAAQAFSEAITQYPVSRLTEESYLLLGRCCYELGLARGAERSWSTLVTLFPKSPFRATAMGELAALAFREGRSADGDSITAVLRIAYGKSPALDPGAYAAGMAARERGDVEKALARLAMIEPESDYGSAARYARAECFATAGREDAALLELRGATAGAAYSRGDAAMAAEAWVAIGRKRLLAGQDASAMEAFEEVDPRDDLRGGAAIGKAWASLRRGDADVAMEHLADGSRWTGGSRLEGPLLRAVAQKELGDLAGAQASLEETARESAELGKAPRVAAVRARSEAARASLRDLETPAWAVLMRRPTEERTAEVARIGARLLPAGVELAEARRGVIEAGRVEQDATRIAAADERAELLLASVMLLRQREGAGKTAAAKPAAPPAPPAAGSTNGEGAIDGTGSAETAAQAGTDGEGTDGGAAASGGAASGLPFASGEGLLTRRDGTELNGRVVSLALSDVGFQPAGTDSVRLVPRAEVHRILYADGAEVAVGKLHKDDKGMGYREAYIREVNMKPYLLETELEIPKREVAERSTIRALIVSGVATMFVDGQAKLIVFPTVFAAQFALSYFTGL